MFCYKCGEENPDEAKYCRNCGADLKEEEPAKKVEVIEAPKSHQNTEQRTTEPSKKRDNSEWLGCCFCLVAIFIIFAIFGIL